MLAHALGLLRQLGEAELEGGRLRAEAPVALRRVAEVRVGDDGAGVLARRAPRGPAVAALLPRAHPHARGRPRPVDVAVKEVRLRVQPPRAQHQALPLAGVGDDVVLHLHAHHRRAVGREGRVVVRRLGERGVAQPARVGVHDGMVLPRDVRAAVVDEVAVRVRVPRLERELRRVLPHGQRAVRDEDVV